MGSSRHRAAGATATAALRRLHPLDVAWAAFSLTMLALMLASPDIQTVPYHFIFVSFTLLYGFRLWSPRVTVTVLLGVTVVTGLLFLEVYLDGRVSLDELAEVPLMPAIVGAMAWHALRHQAAQRRVEELAALESSRVDRQREFLRDASHAIRTPVTIARGHVELLSAALDHPESQDDAAEVLHQLDRLHHLAGRLLAIEQLETADELHRAQLDIATFVATLGRRWSASAQRVWVVDAQPSGLVPADERRLEEAVDALVENALRFTGPQDTVSVSCLREGRWVEIEVGDSGPGIPPADRRRVFDRFFHRHPLGEEPGTGLGLALVQAVSTAHGGTAWAAESVHGGAAMVMRLPVEPVGQSPSPRQAAPEPVGSRTS